MKEQNYVLFADTDMDVTPEVVNRYGAKLISMPYTMDEEDVYPYQSFEKFDEHAFYEKLRNGAKPKTSALAPADYIKYFEPIFKDGKDVLYVHFSVKMSGTFNALALAEKELKEKYPDRTIYQVDTRAISVLAYNIFCEIGDMYLKGATVDEILKWSETELDHFTVYFYANDLSFFRRSGRVNALAAVMGNLLGIRPIIYMDAGGMMTSIDKARGLAATLDKIMNYVKTLQDDIKNHRVVIAQGDAMEHAKLVKERLLAEFGDDLNIEIVPVNPTAGCHCGPDCIGVSFHSIKR